MNHYFTCGGQWEKSEVLKRDFIGLFNCPDKLEAFKTTVFISWLLPTINYIDNFSLFCSGDVIIFSREMTFTLADLELKYWWTIFGSVCNADIKFTPGHCPVFCLHLNQAHSVTPTLLIMKTTKRENSFFLPILMRLIRPARSPWVCLISLPHLPS